MDPITIGGAVWKGISFFSERAEKNIPRKALRHLQKDRGK